MLDYIKCNATNTCTSTIQTISDISKNIFLEGPNKYKERQFPDIIFPKAQFVSN